MKRIRDQLTPEMRRLERRLVSFTPLWPLVHSEWEAMQYAHFDSMGRGAWLPQSDATAERRPGGKLLNVTGKLRASTAKGRGHVRIATPQSLTVGTRLPYARFHQHGTGRMPARQVIAPSPQFLHRVAGMMLYYVAGGMTSRNPNTGRFRTNVWGT
ncbi:MAG TPA: hypothetical protein VEB22_07465 [Phycisphaerales bacterium]|nr:hypothetical protein [Phycisphaerales bacterium]